MCSDPLPESSTPDFSYLMPDKPNLISREHDLDSFILLNQISIPVYPSYHIAVPDRNYNEAVEILCNDINLPNVYFDGEIIIIPESYKPLVDFLVKRFDAQVVADGECKEHEFATLAIRAGVSDCLVALGNAIVGLDGDAASMLSKALDDPNSTLNEWNVLYLASMNPH